MKYCTVCKRQFDDTVSFCSVDGEVLEEDPTSFVGSVLDGQYKIESLLGKGGMGAVYLARHILLGDRVAIKILPPEVRNNSEWLRRFRREGQAARRFRHPNAVTVYDLRTANDGTIYMVMEYVEGQTLDAELQKRGRFTAAEAFEILEPIMSVLNTAHAMGVVHRDLKPENIMIGKAQTDGEPTIKLLDLGIAKMREVAGAETTGTTNLTIAGQVLGTPYYMSPEQWGELPRDGNPEIDGRTDIYSLGLVAYQMITGQRPYAASTLHELRREHISFTPPPLSEKFPDVPRAFSDAITKAISKDRADRQATAGELSAQLRAALTQAGSTAPAGRTYPDIPHVESSYSHTQETPGGRTTKSDVNAATILTVEATPTSPPNVAPPVFPPPAPAAPLSDARGFVSSQPVVGDLGSSVTVVRERPPQVAPKKGRGKTLAFAGVGVLILGLVVIAVGGVLVYSWVKAKPGNTAVTATDPGTPDGHSAQAVDFGKYWLEVSPGLLAESQRVVGTKPIKSGQDFKFHFELGQRGFLYIIGPGEGNQPTAFLTERPASISGLSSNEVTKNSDFSFPSGIEHWLTLDQNSGTDNYTVIFSPERLSSPKFFTEQATGKPLSDTEQSELKDFLAKNKVTQPLTEINDKGSSPFVNVKTQQPVNGATPLIFDIRIQHN